jgi:hypothetical protein
MAHNVLRLGEGCQTDAQFSHKNQWQLLPNRCYLLVRFISTELELESKRFFFSFLCDGKY